MWYLIAALFTLSAAHRRGATFPAPTLSLNAVTFDTVGRVSWKEMGDDVVFSVEANTLGWVSVGMSASGGMLDADLYVLLESDPSVFKLVDMYSMDYVQPTVDAMQSVTLLTAGRNATHTFFTFTRPLDTFDRLEDHKITRRHPFKLVFSFSETKDFTQKHSVVRSAQVAVGVSLVVPADEAFPPAEGLTSFEARMQKTPVGKGNPYTCKLFEVAPNLRAADGKSYLYGVFPLVETGSPVHHIIIFGCSEGHTKRNVSDVWQCPSTADCVNVLGTWAPGVGGFWNPEGVAFPLPTGLYVLQIHYFNPTGAAITDSSGMRLYLSKKKPEVVSGVFLIGTPHFYGPEVLTLIAGETTLSNTNVCPSTYTKKYLPAEGVMVTGIIHHMHTRGRKMRVVVVRKGVEIELSNEYYDFNFQYLKPLIRGVEEVGFRLMPGDELRMVCHFNTAGIEHTIKAGEDTTDEMCLAFLQTIPAWTDAGFAGCFSMPIPEDFYPTAEDMGLTLNPGYRVAFGLPDFGGISIPNSTRTLELITADGFAPPRAKTMSVAQTIAAAARGSGPLVPKTASSAALPITGSLAGFGQAVKKTFDDTPVIVLAVLLGVTTLVAAAFGALFALLYLRGSSTALAIAEAGRTINKVAPSDLASVSSDETP